MSSRVVLTAQTVTLSFDETEDRMRMACQCADETVAVMWLTCALTGRLLPHLRKLAVPETPDWRQDCPRADTSAEGDRKLPEVPKESASVFFLIKKIDVAHNPENVEFLFHSNTCDTLLRFVLDKTTLQVWLAGFEKILTQMPWVLHKPLDRSVELSPSGNQVTIH